MLALFFHILQADIQLMNDLKGLGMGIYFSPFLFFCTLYCIHTDKGVAGKNNMTVPNAYLCD